jgi:RNA polymerase sigma factor (sigma-70 family)
VFNEHADDTTMTPRALFHPARLARRPVLSTQSDERLVDLVRAGSDPAFEAIVERYRRALMRYVSRLLGPERAEDVVQQAFVKAYCALGRFKDGAAFKPWLLSIVANETRNTVRAAGRRRTLADREAALVGPDPLIRESADPAVAALETERRVALLGALEELSEEHRLVVTYRYLLEMDEPETAQALGWPRGTVKSRLNRALRKLERLLPDFQPREGGDEHE